MVLLGPGSSDGGTFPTSEGRVGRFGRVKDSGPSQPSSTSITELSRLCPNWIPSNPLGRLRGHPTPNLIYPLRPLFPLSHTTFPPRRPRPVSNPPPTPPRVNPKHLLFSLLEDPRDPGKDSTTSLDTTTRPSFWVVHPVTKSTI